MTTFLGIERLSLGPWQAFERATQRLLVHAGFVDVRLVGGTGDGGGDIVGEYGGRVWVFQTKFRGGGQLVGTEPIDEVTLALSKYGADVGVVAVNTGFRRDAIDLARKRAAEIGAPIYLWNHDVLTDRLRRLPRFPEHRAELRPYQEEAVAAINERILQGATRGLLLMATGLGKSVVAASIIERWIEDHPSSEVLVLAPSLGLLPQLEASLWPNLGKDIPTHILSGVEKPAFEGGVTVATFQSVGRIARDYAGRFGLVVVDEAHHAPADGYRELLQELEPLFLLGMTATPWRGDERDLAGLFGAPTYSVSIVDGMQHGYLAEVDYRMLVDDLDWSAIDGHVGESVSIKELNRRLFIPERDDAIVSRIQEHLTEIANPRCVIFCRSITHAESVTRLLHATGTIVKAIHSRIDRFETTRLLHDFRSGLIPVIVAVDMLNEGIDIPSVNLIVFLRVTHSRRVFVQQLGRGLRLAEGKTAVRVLDFVADVRRIAAGLALNREAREIASTDDRVVFRTRDVVTFSNDSALEMFAEYLADVAELEDASDQSKLSFPPHVS